MYRRPAGLASVTIAVSWRLRGWGPQPVTAVSQRGGPKIQEELDPLAPAGTTDVVVSGGGDLHAKHILHAVGPRFQE